MLPLYGMTHFFVVLPRQRGAESTASGQDLQMAALHVALSPSHLPSLRLSRA